MEEKEQSVMVALLPVEGQLDEIESPHLTLVYCGEVPELTDGTLEFLSKNASSVAKLSRQVVLKSTGVDLFGEEEKVYVIRLHTTEQLLAIRSFFEDWDRGDFPNYKPHITIGENMILGAKPPIMIKFDRIVVGWGEKRLVFSFNS